MTDRAVEASPQIYARICGILYLFIIVAALFAEALVRSRLIVPTDAAATANNIMASESLFRIGYAGELLMLSCDIAVALILYVLLRPVHKDIALLAAFFRLASDIAYGIDGVNQYAPLRFLGGDGYLKAFDPHQLQALALLSLKLHSQGYAISLIFFGFGCLFLGYLVFRSGYLPKVLGVLLMIAGPCYLINSFADVLAPAFAHTIFPAILIPAAIAEYSLCLWLIVMGVNVPKWKEKVRVAGYNSSAPLSY